MRIAIVTDAWAPQVNGVVRTLENVIAELRNNGHEVLVVSPADAPSVPCPTYPEIRLALIPPAAIGRRIARFGAEAVHVATEGPLGVAARHWCLSRRLPFTTAYHTQFPDYVAARTGANPEWIWRYVRWFHTPAAAVLASTPTIERALNAHGLTRIRRWGRGVAPLFRPQGERNAAMATLPGPILLHVGRVAVEKNIAAFLAVDIPGTKVVVGDGPARGALERQYPDAIFLGALFGEALADAYRAADVLVFPSRTDTFGLVMVEALACGTPVAAFPVAGPVDVLTPDTGAMHEELSVAITRALTLDRAACAAAGAQFTWPASAQQFLDALQPFGAALARAS
ncbi:glycosyltransferase family 4 protein [Sphingomonas sp. 8AM]|uniref:glycosyltransferase family 4 protein n=1 Tax=Sphingomonas sp. 8AM TaxID=2653170 RepID=UPI0012F157C1|nr:glycosyltransferase family 1 protein [Sphingomonas sp. 8AM]VXC89454.1 Alpha-mannosyltransferase [Sphingomonas sp. 8AM]